MLGTFSMSANLSRDVLIKKSFWESNFWLAGWVFICVDGSEQFQFEMNAAASSKYHANIVGDGPTGGKHAYTILECSFSLWLLVLFYC